MALTPPFAPENVILLEPLKVNPLSDVVRPLTVTAAPIVTVPASVSKVALSTLALVQPRVNGPPVAFVLHR